MTQTAPACQPPKRKAQSPRRAALHGGRRLGAGFTLIEMVTSLLLMSIIVVALGSAMVLMLRTAGGETTNAAGNGAATRAAVDRVIDDLKLALTIPEQAATAVTVTVPDRDGDSQPETIRYAWSGTAGDPLTRQYNGGTAASIADNVTSFNVQHILRTVGPANPLPPVEGAEEVLISSDTTASITSFGLKSTNKVSQYFRPSLPANAIKWRITRIKVQVMRNSSWTGSVQFGVYNPDGSRRPTGSSLDSDSISLSTINYNSTAWVEMYCSQLDDLTPGQGFCLVTTASTGSVSSYAWYTTAAGSYPGALMTSTNGGAYTAADGTKALQFYVYGTVTTQE